MNITPFRRTPTLRVVSEPPILPPKNPALAWVDQLLGEVSATARETAIDAITVTQPLNRRIDHERRMDEALARGERTRSACDALRARVELMQNVVTAATIYVDDACIGNLLALRDALLALELHQGANPL